ncbi:hypothetical protein [Pseudoalteromonas nigrifaciens]|uniref:hypothetical protein n=1 Tax=Pseudoalteromonas nigrifaciens TaxID=28109 RepID=UPI003FD525CD
MKNRETLTQAEIEKAIENGCEHCVVEARSTGEICWDINDTREREPVHYVKKGERFSCWNFRKVEDGLYTHDYGNMGPSNVVINTNVELSLVYITDNADDLVLFNVELEKCPNIT